MCGITGYIGRKKAFPILINGLERLEYRGYDSAGVCTSSESGLNLLKRAGKVAELTKENELEGNQGIAHTRWATHGKPNRQNAHPHSDCSGKIAVVHNGIIENQMSLRKLLKKEGHRFRSETDSEVLVHLIEKFYSGNLENAVIKTLRFVEGTFGIAVLHANEEKIVAARRGSPLVIGVGDREMFLASDVAALMDHTKKVVYLSDNEVAVITGQGFSVKKLNGRNVDKKVKNVKWEISRIEKKGYKHFMLKEIMEQPDSLSNTLRGRVKKDRVKLTLDTGSADRVIMTACGTSWHSGLIGKYLLEKMVRIPVEVDYASELRYRRPVLGENDLVTAISQSGETADTLAALKEAKKLGARTMGIVNVVGSSIAREVDSGIYLHAGPEIGVASTKAFTCQVTALILFGMYLRRTRGLEPDRKLLGSLGNLPEKVQKVLERTDKIKGIARTFRNSPNFLYLGRGLNFPVALEGALKLKEISYIHAEGYPAAEMKHGPIALIDESMPVVFLATRDRTYEKILSNMQEVKARKGRIIAVVNRDSGEVSELADHIIKVPEVPEELAPIVNVIPLQLLAYYMADLKGLDPDRPKNLAKSVTVE